MKIFVFSSILGYVLLDKDINKVKENNVILYIYEINDIAIFDKSVIDFLKIENNLKKAKIVENKYNKWIITNYYKVKNILDKKIIEIEELRDQLEKEQIKNLIDSNKYKINTNKIWYGRIFSDYILYDDGIQEIKSDNVLLYSINQNEILKFNKKDIKNYLNKEINLDKIKILTNKYSEWLSLNLNNIENIKKSLNTDFNKYIENNKKIQNYHIEKNYDTFNELKEEEIINPYINSINIYEEEYIESDNEVQDFIDDYINYTYENIAENEGWEEGYDY